MAARNKARKRAFQILFEADQRGESVQTVLADWVRLSRTDDRQPPVGEFTMELGTGRTLRVRGDSEPVVGGGHGLLAPGGTRLP
ncbi:hypothetical protein ABZ689_30850, partial [Streptomyces sp. NPDC006874]